MPEPRSWTIELPPGIRVLSLNDRLHWAEKGRRAKALREAAWAMACQQQIPQLHAASLVVEYRPPDRRRRDNDNIPAASAKPAIDGIVQARVLRDDSWPHVTSIAYRIGEIVKGGQLAVTITEVIPPSEATT